MKNDGPNDCQLVLEMLLFLMEESGEGWDDNYLGFGSQKYP